MDYEKKYNEALGRAKKFEEKYGGGYAEYIFPELAESEDERIKKTIRQLLETARDAHSNTSLAKPFIDALAWLENQKENPKSADSIQSDCTSDAKCEDRWHKVSDSLPDNPREVLCKDEAGNYFIGRYYTGEGWEISNYDDEDKPHHLNPPVSKWIDFPSEKQKEPENTSASTMAPSCWEVEQKEQKPKAKAKSPLSPHELYDAKIEGISQGRQDVLDHPEQFGLQKPAEWSEEDEKMRNLIIESLDDDSHYFPFKETKKKMMDWLSSLRPQYHGDVTMTEAYKMGLEAGKASSWKPSEHQMDILKAVKDYVGKGSGYWGEALGSLIEDLEKL